MDYRLPDQKYSEAEYLFQTIEMAKSDEEYDVELCATPPHAGDIADLELVQEPLFAGKVVMRRQRRQRPHRRYTFSHGGGGGSGGGCGGAPPAPPSTPTSLTVGGGSGTPTPSPTASSISFDYNENKSRRLTLQYIPPLKYKKKFKEQQRTDAELAELFNVVTITGGGSGDSTKRPAVAFNGICSASRVIRKEVTGTKIFKIHRNPKDFFREHTPLARTYDEEDSVSAPEYDDDTAHVPKKTYRERRLRRIARFEHYELMDDVVNAFDSAMSLNSGSNANGKGSLGGDGAGAANGNHNASV